PFSKTRSCHAREAKGTVEPTQTTMCVTEAGAISQRSGTPRRCHRFHRGFFRPAQARRSVPPPMPALRFMRHRVALPFPRGRKIFEKCIDRQRGDSVSTRTVPKQPENFYPVGSLSVRGPVTGKQNQHRERKNTHIHVFT